MKKLFTIFTPTYNRVHTLKKLYSSLCTQNYKNFEWVIVDDGSTDETENYLNTLKNLSKISITYYRQNNAGKHIAINKGLDLATGEWFFIVDSDDFLPHNSLETLKEHIKTLPSAISGVVARKAFEGNKIIGNQFRNYSFVSDSVERKYIYKIDGDLAEVYKADVMRKYKFPIIPNQKFCAEGLLWNRLAKNHKALFVNDVVYIAEYLEGGLSANSILNRRKSPDYAMLLYKELAEDKRLSLFIKARTYINYWRFSFFNKESILSNWNNINNNLFALFFYPAAYAIKLWDDVKIKKIKKIENTTCH